MLANYIGIGPMDEQVWENCHHKYAFLLFPADLSIGYLVENQYCRHVCPRRWCPLQWRIAIIDVLLVPKIDQMSELNTLLVAMHRYSPCRQKQCSTVFTCRVSAPAGSAASADVY